MKRRDVLAGSLGGAAIALFGTRSVTAGGQLPKRDHINVAFLLGQGANVIDTAGPWEVFQDTMIGDDHPFRLYTVAPSKDIVEMTAGLEIKPKYSIENAPAPNVIVVPAQRTTEASRAWLKRASAQTDVTMSVCTGAFQLARVGLLDGLSATTHHEYWDEFAKEFPKVELKRGLRFVDNGRVATAGGLTSGIDMALHIVGRYLAADVAAATARYMEHDSTAWREGL